MTKLAIALLALIALILSAAFTYAMARQGSAAPETNWRDAVEPDFA